MYRIPCAIRYIHDEVSPACILTLSRADLTRLTALVRKIKDGTYKGVELAGKDGKVCRLRCENGLLAFALDDVTLRLDENQDESFASFLADMTADAPRMTMLIWKSVPRRVVAILRYGWESKWQVSGLLPSFSDPPLCATRKRVRGDREAVGEV